jgi:SNF2 family DNA or RNA helicase
MSLDTIQSAAIEKLSRLRAGALFMKMGTGKTRVAIKLAESRQHDFAVLIWIAPASLLADADYHAEIVKWSNNLRVPIAFFSTEGISLSDGKYLELRNLAESTKSFCVVDESLDIKNAEAGRTARLLALRDLFAFRLILNGTPITKGLIDFYAQITFLSGNILGMKESQFAYQFLEYRREGRRPWMRWSRPANEAALIEIIRPYIFDADLDIDAELCGPKTVNLRLSNSEAAAYADFKREFLEKNPFCSFLATAQAFQSFYTLSASKLEHLRDTLPRDRKSLIFVKFLDEVDALTNMFPDASVMTGRGRQHIAAFKRDRDVLISTYGTGSRGLNLQHATNIVFFSQTFNWMHKVHGLYRAYRTGQTEPVTASDYRLDTGLENIMALSEHRKENTAKNVNAFIKANGAEAL